MYLTAASAAWRYSGKVTGPDSRFSSPSVTADPVAFFGVPSAAALLCDDEPPLWAVGVAVLLEPLSSLEPQPAATSMPAATAAAAARARVLLSFTGSLLLMGVPSGGRNRGLAEIAGAQQVAPAAQIGGAPFEHEPAVAEHVGAVGDLER